MIKHIYKIKNKIVDSIDIENSIISYTYIEPIIVASVICGKPKKVNIYNEEGELTGEEEVFNIQEYYPSFDEKTMIASDKKFIEPKVVDGEIVEGYIEPEIIEPEPIEVVLTDEETLEQLKNDIIFISKELLIAREAGIGYNVEKLESARESLIEQHKKLSETVAYTETEEEVSENV